MTSAFSGGQQVLLPSTMPMCRGDHSVMEELFVMVMLVNIDHLSGGINGLSQSMNELGEEKNLKIHVMHEDIFHSMHRI